MKAVFLDRDGTMILDPPDLRVDNLSDLHLFPDTVKALRLLSTLDFGVIEVTNQAGIGEGRIDRAEFEHINNMFMDLIEASGVKFLKIYVCPHKAEDNCACHKPKPLMVLEAAAEFDIDLAESYVIGDRESDIMTGVNAGTKTILVQTGNTPVVSPEATYTATDLLDAVKYIAAH